MRTALVLAAALAITACTDDGAIDPAWTTPGAATECDAGGAGDLPASLVGSYRLTWACRGGGAEGTDPCNPDLNPMLSDSDVDVTASATAGDYVLRIDGREIALASSGSQGVFAEPFSNQGTLIQLGILTCSTAQPIVLAVTAADSGWYAAMTRQ